MLAIVSGRAGVSLTIELGYKAMYSNHILTSQVI